MKRYLTRWSLMLCAVMAGSALPASAATDLIKATILVTDSGGTVNGDTLTVNGDTRTWTNNVIVPGSQILTNNSIGGAATNLFNAISDHPFSGLNVSRSGTNGIILQAAPGIVLTISLSSGWGSVTLSTNKLTDTVAVTIPWDSVDAAQRTNIWSGLITGLQSGVATNAFQASDAVMQNFLGLGNDQTIAGEKAFTNLDGVWSGRVLYSLGISGTILAVTNGLIWEPAISTPTLTNAANYGNAFRSPGTGESSEQFGTSATASGENSVALGKLAEASGSNTLAVGEEALASGSYSTAIGHFSAADGSTSLAVGDSADTEGPGSIAVGNLAATDAGATNGTALGYKAVVHHLHSTAIGAESVTTASNQVMLGTSADTVRIPGPLSATNNCEITWLRFPITTLANGNNAGVMVGTNTFIEVSGPTSAFTINGIAGGRDGKFVIILNQTGQNMTIAHDSGVDSTAANRIYTMTATDRATTGNGAAELIYSGAASRWILISLDP